MSQIQRHLLARGVRSIIPGLVDDADEFAEEGHVTLATVHRAKGNEAAVVYLMAFEHLASYAQEVMMRNRAFTCISRSKAFLTITGVGQGMRLVGEEVRSIRDDIPCFRFDFPDMEVIARNLDKGEVSRRRAEVESAKRSLSTIRGVDAAALTDVPDELLRELEEKLKQARRLRGDD